MESLGLKSNTSETFGAMPKGAWRYLLFDRVVLFLVCALVAFAPSNLQAQTRNRPAATAKAKQSKAEKQTARIVFDYNPAVPDLNFEKSEFAFVAINADGSTQAVRYGPYNPAIIGVYEGKLPETEVAQLVDKARMVIPKASELTEPYIGSCDADSFQLSVTSQTSSVIPSKMSDFACLPAMPKEILGVVEEMRMVWRRLNEARLAYGYVRSFPLSGDFLKSAQWHARHSVSIRKFPPKLRAILRDANKQTPKFYGLNQALYDQLKSLASDPSHFYLLDNGRTSSLTLFLSRNVSHSPSKE